jgi:hypothetical protein
MEGTFLWLAAFFNKYYRNFFEKRCGVKAKAGIDKNRFFLSLKKGRMVIFYSLRSDKTGIAVYRNERPLPLYNTPDPPVLYSKDDALRAFFFLMGKVMREAVCISISSILNYHKIFATVIAPGEPVQVLTEINEETTLTIAPLIKNDKIQFTFYRVEGKFADKTTPVGSIEVPVSKFRPQQIAGAVKQLMGLLML